MPSASRSTPARARRPAGRPSCPSRSSSVEPAANPWRLYLWFWRASRLDGKPLADRLATPPWAAARPALVPAAPWPPDVARQVAPPPRLGFLGRSLTGTGGPYATVYLDALLDQVLLANQQGFLDRALAFSERRLALRPDGEAAAWRLESLRRVGRAAEAEALLRSLPEDARREPLDQRRPRPLRPRRRRGAARPRAPGLGRQCLPGDAASAGARGAARRVAPDARRDDAAAAPGRDSGGPAVVPTRGGDSRVTSPVSPRSFVRGGRREIRIPQRGGGSPGPGPPRSLGMTARFKIQDLTPREATSQIQDLTPHKKRGRALRPSLDVGRSPGGPASRSL